MNFAGSYQTVLMRLSRRQKPPLMLLLLGLLLTAPYSSLSEEVSREYMIKAAYVFRIAQFVDWPESGATAAPLGVCILGEDPFGSAIDYIVEKTSRGRRFSLRRYASSESLGGCHVLFISASETTRLETILSGLEGRSVLTVSDAAEFARCGGMVGLVNRQGKVSLEINQGAAEAAGLQISAKLLELSRIVKPKKKG